MVLAPRKGRTAVAKQSAGEVVEMAHGWAAQGEGAGGGAAVESGVPRAIFVPHANSLPFEERCVSVEQAVKIGRNVCKTAPTPTNAIFECRVLSRHHATLWFDKGHFYIMDNQSSNGTFINNNRCSIGKDSEPHEVFSGDVLQFGIAVVENHTDHDKVEKNTFLPVVTMLKLYLPDGKEAKMVFNPAMTTPLHLKELYQLNNYVQEAVSRETGLEARLQALRESVELTRAEALAGWQLLVGEQRLLARVHALEARLAAGKPVPDHHLQQLLQDKANYREVAQESLRQAHEQRLALEEALEKKSREAYTLLQQICDLRLTADRALAELQKLAARCERKISAAKIAIASAEEREAAARALLPLALSKMNGEVRMLVLCSDSGQPRTEEAHGLAEAVRSLPDSIKLLLPDKLLAQVGLKAINIDAKNVKDCELILKKNDSSEVENRDKGNTIEDSMSSWLQDNCRREDGQRAAEEKNGLANHDSPELNSTEELELNSTELSPDNNANSTFRRVAVENHNNFQSGRSEELACAALRGLRDEVGALRARLAELARDNERLRRATHQLLHLKLEVEEDNIFTNQQVEDEMSEHLIEEQASADSENDTDTEKHDPESPKELEARLERALAAEKLLAEKYASRPLDDYSKLKLTCKKLQEELSEKDQILEQLRQTPFSSTTTLVATCDTSVQTSQETHSDKTPQEIDLDEISALNELDDALEEFNCDESTEEKTKLEDSNIDEDLEEALANLDAVNEEHEDSDLEKGEKEDFEKEHQRKFENKKQENLEKEVEERLEKEEVDNSEKEVEEHLEKEEADNSEKEVEEHLEKEEKENSEKESCRLDCSMKESGISVGSLAEKLEEEEAQEQLLGMQEELVRVKESWQAARAELARLQASRSSDARLHVLAYAAAALAVALYALLCRYAS